MNIWEKMRPPSTINEIKEEALRKASKISGRVAYRGKLLTARRRERVRIETAYKTLKKHIDRSIKILKAYYKSDPFYKDLIKLYFSEEELRKAMKRLEGSERILDKLKNEYIEKIKKIRDAEKGGELRKEALGRIISIVKRQKKQINLAREIWKYAHRLPSINLDEPIVVVSGPPNVGKSSLINKLSNSRLTVASYPFTTKKIHIGHLEEGFLRIQFIDTPGLLDRPLHERNKIEMQAIYALKHLPDLILYMLDPSPERYYEPEKQISILEEITKLFEGKNLIIVINKIDVEEVDFKPLIEEKPVYRISILKDIGVEELKEKIMEKIKNEFLI